MSEQVRSFFEGIGLRVRSVNYGKQEYNVYCPFHAEKEASMFINTNKGVVHCFGQCGEKGNIRSLFYKMNSHEYRGWLDQIMMLTALTLTWEENEDTIKREDIDVESLPYANSNMGYLVKRHITEDTIQKFNLKYHKKFDAIVIPLYEQDGSYRGYVRRNMQGSRYMNSPELDVDTTLYPMDKVNVTGVNKLILVEGMFDAIRAHQEGYSNTVCCFGGRLTDHQIRELGKFASSVVVAPDKDQQGMDIAEYNIDKLQNYGFAIELLLLQGIEKDIAELPKIERLSITSYYQHLFSKKRLTQLV